MARLSWLSALLLFTLNCDSLFGTDMPTAPATAAFIEPGVSFPSGLDCSAGGAAPITVTWGVKPVMLQVGTTGIVSEFSASETLTNVSGTTSDCYYLSASGVSEASGMGLRPGLWQISLTHSVPGFPSPLVCTRNLVLGNNQVAFVFGLQSAACQ